MDFGNLFEILQQTGLKPYETYLNQFTTGNIQGGIDFHSMFDGGMIFTQYPTLEDAFGSIIEARNSSNPPDYLIRAISRVSDRNYTDWDAFKNFINTDDPNLEDVRGITNVITENIKDLINLGGLYEKDRIIASKDKRGIFDFGLASQGLYRPVEFFSQTLADEINDETLAQNPFQYLKLPIGIVDNNSVKRQGTPPVVGFVISLNNKAYSCERRQRGTTLVYETFPDKCELATNKDGLILPYKKNTNQTVVFNGEGKTKLKYASRNEKSYLIYRKKEESVKYVDIFVPINYLTSGTPPKLIINLLPAYLIATTLQEFGIYARISALRTGADRKANTTTKVNTTISITVKDYTEPSKEAFDKITALIGSKGTASTFFAFFKIKDSNSGVQGVTSGNTNTAFGTVEYWQQTYMNELMVRYKNWARINKDEDFVNTRVTNDNFQFALYQRQFDLPSTRIDHENILHEIHFIFFQYYYYLDFLAIEFVDIRQFVRQLYQRITEDATFRKIFSVPTEKKEILQMVRRYTINIMAEKYKTVTSGDYADTIEQTIEKEKIFKEKGDEISEAINLL